MITEIELYSRKFLESIGFAKNYFSVEESFLSISKGYRDSFVEEPFFSKIIFTKIDKIETQYKKETYSKINSDFFEEISINSLPLYDFIKLKKNINNYVINENLNFKRHELIDFISEKYKILLEFILDGETKNNVIIKSFPKFYALVELQKELVEYKNSILEIVSLLPTLKQIEDQNCITSVAVKPQIKRKLKVSENNANFFSYVILELINEGYLDNDSLPEYNGTINYTEISRRFAEIIDFQVSDNTLSNYFNPDRNNLSETKKSRILIPKREK